jgi:ribose transport system ATP-binding protein
MVHQELSIVPSLSVAENVFLGRQPAGMGFVRWGEMMRGAREHLARLGIDVDPHVPAGSLPLGLQQLVELGRVLFSGARIIILDEPTSALSPPEVERLFAVLTRLRGEGRSFIFISHFIDDILKVSDTVTIFRNSRRVLTTPAAEIDKARIIHVMIGRGHEELEETYTGSIQLASQPAGPPVLEARGLALAGAFADVDLAVRPGEVLGVYGFMGCGQLELARVLAGKLRPDRGEIRVAGHPVRLRNTAAAKRAGVALVPESRKSMLFGDAPVFKNITISFLERISPVFLHEGVERRIGQEQVDRLGIRPRSAEPPLRTLSGGNQQKVALARWLVHAPKVLVLSEPTRGMDVGAKDDVVHLVRGAKQQGLGVVVVSAEPETVLALADRIVVMRRGEITREFSNELVGKDQLLAAA